MQRFRHIPELSILSSKSEKDEIVNAFKTIKSFYRNTIVLPKGAFIFRARLGKSELCPKTKSELSYNPFKDKISIGRANPIGYQVFYGTTHQYLTKSVQARAMKTAIWECSELMRSNNDENGYELGCVSRWHLTKELKLFTMFNYDFGNTTDPTIIEYRNMLNKMIEEMSPNPERDIEINMWLAELFAEKFKKEDKHKYQITSMLAKNYLEAEHDGIIYPTVQGAGSAINVALNTTAADSLKLEYVAQIVNVKKHNITTPIFLKQSTTIIDDEIENWTNCE